jgi:hypothetical protein
LSCLDTKIVWEKINEGKYHSNNQDDNIKAGTDTQGCKNIYPDINRSKGAEQGREKEITSMM